MSIGNSLKTQFGSGISFPIEIDSAGRPLIKSDIQLIRDSIKTIISWNTGSRYFLGEYGGNVELLLEEPNDDILRAKLRNIIVTSVATWEKRVEAVSVDITSPDRLGTTLNARINYRIVKTQLEDSFIYPFYQRLVY
jgi:phage baseplate assembly protein W